MDVFAEIPCLTERFATLRGRDLRRKWFKGSDSRALAEALHKFVDYNKKIFAFLNVAPSVIGTDQSAAIYFRTTSFIGAAPLRAPDTGKQIGDLVVAPRFLGRDKFEDYIEILDLLGGEISPEVVDSLPLASGRNFRPPLYLEAAKFIGALEGLLKRRWIKFDNVEVVGDEPVGQINWGRYAANEYKAENRLRFPARKNTLSEQHREFGQIRFVFDICNRELSAPNTPPRIRSTFRSRLSFIESRLYSHKPISVTSIRLRTSDNPAVKACKKQANRVLSREFVDSTAWRVDFNDVFEKFVQFIFRDVAKAVGGKLLTNPRIHAYSVRYYAWELRHLEPDAILQTDNLMVFVDAKYKSHLYNRFEPSDLLKDDFRRDLHQVLAYTSFTESIEKIGIIGYPSNEFEIKSTRFKNTSNDAISRILIVGIPLKRNVIREVVRQLVGEIEKMKAIY